MMKPDERVQEILDLLAEGWTREEIANRNGKGWKSVDQYMRRRDYCWSTEQQTYIPKTDEPEPLSAAAMQSIHTKAAQIIRMLDVKHPNIRQTATKQGFQSIEEMGEYMKSQGYIWNDEIENYQEDLTTTRPVATESAIDSSSEQEMTADELIRYLVQQQIKLRSLLQLESSNRIQTFTFKGVKTNKTLTMASSVATLLEDYQKEYNLTQRAIVETALAEFFQKYGYHDQLKLATT